MNRCLRSALSAPTGSPAPAAEVPSGEADVSAAASEDSAEALEQANEDAQEVLEDLVGINLTPQAEPAYSFALVKSSVPLYSRSLLFWVGAIAFATLFIN